MEIQPFAVLAARPDARLDELALALASEFGNVDAAGAIAQLDRLGEEVAGILSTGSGDPRCELDALRAVLAERHLFVGDRDYDDPNSSMLDRVLVRRRGLPILLSIVYIEVARRAEIDLAGVGLPGHFVVGHFGCQPPILIDPFHRGKFVGGSQVGKPERWSAHETALRMLNNLVGSYQRRHDVARAIRAAELRLVLPLGEQDAAGLAIELRQIRSVLN